MDSITLQGLQILLILQPGFVTSWIVLALTVRPPQTELDKIIEALFYSFVTYFLSVLILGTQPVVVILTQRGGSEMQLGVDVSALRQFVLWSFLISVAMGLIISALNTNDLPTRFLRWAHITRRSSRASVWSDVFHDITAFVIIEFTDGHRLRGWPRYFSDTPEEASLFLERAAWLLDDGTPVEIEGPGILVTKNLPIQTISFWSGVRTQQ